MRVESAPEGEGETMMTSGQKKGKKGLVVLVVVVAFCGISTLVCGGAVALFAFVGAPGSTANADELVEQLNHERRAVDALGSPIRSVSIESDGSVDLIDEELLDMRILVSGPRGRARLHATGSRRPGRLWSYDTLALTVESSGERIDLLRR